MKRIIILALLIVPLLSFTQDNNLPDYDSYHDQLKEQFKSESWWYKRFNQYEINPGFSKYSIGPALTYPLSGWDNVHRSFGVRYRQTHFEIGAAFWKAQLNNEVDTNNFSRISLGYFTPATFTLASNVISVVSTVPSR